MLRNWVGWGGWVGDGWSCPLDLDPHFNTTSWVSWYPSTAAERWRHSSVESGANWPHARKWAGGRWLPSLMTYWLQAMPAEKCNPMATPWSADNALIQLGRYPNRAIGNPGHRDPSKPCAFQRGSTQNPQTSPLLTGCVGHPSNWENTPENLQQKPLKRGAWEKILSF